MCVTCGCGDPNGATWTLREPPHDRHEHVHADGTRHSHSHSHLHEHELAHSPSFAAVPFRQAAQHGINEAAASTLRQTSQAPGMGLDSSIPGRSANTIHLETLILGKNQAIADRNRVWLSERGILALNLVSSPGAGKTTLLERTLQDLKSEMHFSVIEGDQATSNDADRIRATGVPALQINTGTGCHLEADMLERALDALQPPPASLLMIENVGNLVCPALFDLGERAKVVIFSITEGEDKPLKYPHMFGSADVLLLSKIDLLPHLRFDVERAVANALTVNPRLTVFRVSSHSGEGLAPWYGWLKSELTGARSRSSPPAPRHGY
jgi:hydrogenase nickel incorporation protein HypB